MSLEIKCSFCGNELCEPGGLLFGPPNEANYAVKSHLCVDCYKKVIYRQFTASFGLDVPQPPKAATKKP